MSKKYDVAAYIWPAFTGTEPRALQFWPEGMGEWQTVKNPTYKPQWNNKNPQPLWGYVNEADKYVMETQINAAADHGVNVFIYDWYWYDNQPFLEQCLDNGYLKARNNDRVKFYLMWANHDAKSVWDKPHALDNTVIWPGAVDDTQFDTITDRVINKYFSHPSYYKIDGCPVFMIYDIANLIKGLGGVENTRKALDMFRQKVIDAGFSGLHIQMCSMRESIVDLSGVDTTMDGSTKDAAMLLGFDSVTNYQFVQIVGMGIRRPYPEVLEDAKKEWDRLDKEYPMPYYPHISMGWDNNPRYEIFIPELMSDNTPENFEKGLRDAKKYLDEHPNLTPLVTINAWNEWTELSYLQPDTINGYAYLEAVKRVFLDQD